MNEARLRALAVAYGAALEVDGEVAAAREGLRARAARVAARLAPSAVAALDEAGLRALLFDTTALGGLTHREWELRRRLASVGLAGLRDALLELLSRGALGLRERELAALARGRGLGLMLTTELLAYRYPARYWLFSPSETLAALARLGDDVRASLPPRGRSDAAVYFALAPRMLRLREALAAARVSPAEHLDAACFLAWLRGPAERAPSAASSEAPAPRTPRRLRERAAPTPPAVAPRATSAPPPREQPPSLPSVAALLDRAVRSRGLHFSAWTLGAFYTALQVKGFVLLTGISGTGKTRLAQRFAEALPQPPAGPAPLPPDAVAVGLTAAGLHTGRLALPPGALRTVDAPYGDDARDLQLRTPEGVERCGLTRVTAAGREAYTLLLRAQARRWLAREASEGDALVLEPEVDQDERLSGFRGSLRAAWPAAPTPGEESPRSWLFLPVRPDFRDGRALLGYFNPLSRTYEWTAFLRFVLRAAASYRSGSPLAWFVLLDEMNLAPVEHYFAELLSVLEAGRDEHGYTREALCFAYPDDAEGPLPPRALHLPPNLYFVGTVNVDESTHAFSPKVLDRAFCLELAEVDLDAYLAAAAQPPARPLDEGERLALLQRFTRGGRFAGVERAHIPAELRAHPTLGARLAALHAALAAHGQAFGYRVLDECVAFCAEALRNEALGEGSDAALLDRALDAAVLAKVLPKLHGARARVEGALAAVYRFCLRPDVVERPAHEAPASFDDALDDAGVDDLDDERATTRDDARALARAALPRSAERASRALRLARVSGYVPFG